MGKKASMGGILGCFVFIRRARSQQKKLCPPTEGKTIISLDAKAAGKLSECECDESIASCWIWMGMGMGLKRFSWEEIERVTANFSEVIGVGGFSTVYLARFPDQSTGLGMGAVKVYKSSERLSQVFKSEVEISSQLSHPNIVSLLGYCDQTDEGVLVFEYIPNGCLQEKLHNKSITQVLPWKTRMAIAYQLAQALEHLHEQRSPHIVHGDIKASNILLLDEATTPSEGATVYCKLCDFGFAKMGFSSTIKPHSSSSSASRIAMMGSPGYIDPHYLMTGIASKKSDIYSFGVVLLELIMGVEAFCPEKEQLLTSLVRNTSRDFDVDKVVGMVDPRLERVFNTKEVRAMACISAMCLHHLPTLRPSATEVIQAMRENISSISSLCASK